MFSTNLLILLPFLLGPSVCIGQCVAYLVPMSVPVYAKPAGADLWPEKREGYLLALPIARDDYRPPSYVKVQDAVPGYSLYSPRGAGCIPESFRRVANGRVKVFVSKPATGLLETAWVPERECVRVKYTAPSGLTVDLDVQSTSDNLALIRAASLKALQRLTTTPSGQASPP